MNDVRDSRRKHLDELDKETEMKEMIKKLKTTWTAFGGLTKEEQGFLREHIENVGIFCDMRLQDIGACCVDSPCAVYRVYRLRPDFQLPEPVKERWFFDTTHYRFRMGKPSSLLCGKWIEITAEQKAYIETKPEPVEGFEWVLKVPDFEGRHIPRPLGSDNYTGGGLGRSWLNGISWRKVPVKVAPRVVEYDIKPVAGIYRVCRQLETENAALKSAVEELMDELSRLQSVVGEEDYAIIEQKLKDAEGLL